MSYGYTERGFAYISDPPPLPSDFCTRCGHHRDRHNAGCGCTASKTGDLVTDHVCGPYCDCRGFVSPVEEGGAATK